MSIRADSHADAVELLDATLAGIDNVHAPPMPTKPQWYPAVYVGMPEILVPPRLDQTSGTYGCDIRVVAGDSEGRDLITLTDQVVAALHTAGMAVTTSAVVFTIPGYGPVPAMTLTVT